MTQNLATCLADFCPAPLTAAANGEIHSVGLSWALAKFGVHSWCAESNSLMFAFLMCRFLLEAGYCACGRAGTLMLSSATETMLLRAVKWFLSGMETREMSVANSCAFITVKLLSSPESSLCVSLAF